LLIGKWIAALWLCAVLISPLLKAEPKWVIQHGARLVIGQNSFTRSNPRSSREVIGSAGGVAVGGNVLAIAEGNRIGATPINNRVLIYKNLSGFIPAPEAALPQGGPKDFCPACVGQADVVVGQPDFTTFTDGTQNGRMKAPSGVATDGIRLAVADTNNNRVLLWNTIPQTNGTPPNLVLGQPDLNTNLPNTTATGMRGPQGVWIDSGRLFVADTQNSRILIWKSLPTSNGQAADIVVGQPDFVTRPEPDLAQSNYTPNAQRLLNPASVQVINNKMFVADLGFDRVMIYLSIPAANNAPADVVVGQPNFETFAFVRATDPGLSADEDGNIINANGDSLMDGSGQALRRAVVALCQQIGPFDDDGTITPDNEIFPDPIKQDPTDVNDLRYPKRCESTLNFPRFALSDGTRLFISDSGNDRILVYNQIPLENGAPADVVIGQPDFIALTDSDGAGNLRAPGALAHDGKNLYVADPLQRRILVFTPGEEMIARDGIRNGASFDVKANGHLEWNGTATSAQTATVNISGQEHKIEIPTGTTAAQLRDKVVESINNRAGTLVTAQAMNGPGRLSRAMIQFSGSTRAGDIITLRIGNRSYSVEMLGPPADPGPYIAIDRLMFVVNQAGGDPEVTVRRFIADINRLEIVSNTPGSASNGLPVSIEIPSGSPLIAEIVDIAGEGDGKTSGELTGGAFPAFAWLTAVAGGRPGNAITIENLITGSTASTPGITAGSSGARLDGGSDARFLPPGTFASLFGEGFADQLLVATSNDGSLPKELGGVRVYVNGIQAPISSVAPNQVNFQVPWEIIEEVEITNTGISTYVWRRMPNGSVVVSAPRANQVTNVAPGLFAFPGPEPRRAVAVHAQAVATADVAVGLPNAANEDVTTVPAGITLTIKVVDNSYSYTSVANDTLDKVRDGLIAAINSGAGDPNVTASAGTVSFFSAQARVDLSGEPKAGDVVNIDIGSPIPADDDNPDDDDDSLRRYSYTVREGDNLTTIRNLLVFQINSGRGDVDVTAREDLSTFGTGLQIVARQLGVQGNKIRFQTSASAGAGVQVKTEEDGGFLERGSTDPAVRLSARVSGKEGNKITFSASSSDGGQIQTTVRQLTLCCGNEPFSLVDEANPAIPGEIITLFASGLGLTAPLPGAANLASGQPTPSSPLFQAPYAFLDFVSSLMGVSQASGTIEFAGLMPGFVGIYQINLKVFEGLPDNPRTPLTIAQRDFISNTVTIPVKPLQPRDPEP
jgi:uncharacterized protein (TIGR03437 family)